MAVFIDICKGCPFKQMPVIVTNGDLAMAFQAEDTANDIEGVDQLTGERPLYVFLQKYPLIILENPIPIEAVIG